MTRGELWKSLTKQQKNRLKRYTCGGCDAYIDGTVKHGCWGGWFGGHMCSDELVVDRAIRCLDAARKPEIRYTEDKR